MKKRAGLQTELSDSAKSRKKRVALIKFICIFQIALFFFLVLSFTKFINLGIDTKSLNSLHIENSLSFDCRLVHCKAPEHGTVIEIDSAKVIVLDENRKVFKELYSNRLGVWHLNLPLNQHYTIKVSKRGWITKTMKVDTRVPSEEYSNLHFLIHMYFFEEIPELNTSILKKPIATIYYNRALRNFDYNYRYTYKVYQEMRDLYYDYYRSHLPVQSAGK